MINFDKIAINNILKTKDNIVVSHKDLDLPNILWDSKNNPAIIDWELAGLVNPIEELIVTAWDWSGGQDHFDIEKFKLFIKTYTEITGNIQDFEYCIYSNVKNNLSWLEYNLKRVCRIECFDEEEQNLAEQVVITVINEIFKYFEIIKKYKIEEIS